MNILILSSGTRNKIVQYFRKGLEENGNVICTDMSIIAPSIYEADKFYTVPRITAPEYLDVILNICEKEKIDGVLSLIDPELSLLAEYKDKFDAIGTTVIGSSYELCEMSLDKFKMYNWLTDHGYKCAKSYMDKEEFYADVEAGKAKYPVFVKPARGSASIAISKVYEKEMIEFLFEHGEGLMIQSFWMVKKSVLMFTLIWLVVKSYLSLRKRRFLCEQVKQIRQFHLKIKSCLI